MNENFNVSLPVFTIHGNHDDPTRDGGSTSDSLSAVDTLACANLVNYFGKADRVDDINIYPILVQKGATTKVAIYGLGSIRDERLNRMFSQKKVKFVLPKQEQDQWFNIFMIHQNREQKGRGAKNCVLESMLPDFLDMVIWGHEHECIIDPVESLKQDYHVTQPGSSVATSLVEGEARTKHVGLLEIRGESFRMEPIMLRSVRPFVFDTLVLSEQEELDPNGNEEEVQEAVQRVLQDKVDSMIERAREEMVHGDGKTPLVRLKVEYTGFSTVQHRRP